MKSLLKLLAQRWFLVALGLLLVALAIWFGGPYLAFGEAKPLEGVLGRLLAIILLVGGWGLSAFLKAFRARKAAESLAKSVSEQGAKDKASAGLGAAEAQQLRERFDEALGALRASKGKSVNLYELPWYIIIGPPGAGKTTAIANSGLNFPLSKKFGKEALRGVGGTRNCDWWFTDEAVLLDTAGRYTTQDSDAESDHAGWTEFLSLLRKHRSRRPINGVIVAMSAADLLSQSEIERRKHVEAVRRRLDELKRELKINLPVYLLLTKMDLIAGFSEYFDDLDQDGRAQVWGVTFPLEASRSGDAPATIAAEFDRLLERLSSRLMLRLEAERDVRRRALVFTFPRQFSALRRGLVDFVTDAFATERERKGDAMQLRGVYFTSGTQDGTPIDRMLGALARSFGLSVRAAVAQPVQGRTYFLQRLLKQVIFKESGLAGVNKQMEMRYALLHGSIYASVVLAIVLGIVAFSVSYQRNRSYLERVGEAAQTLAAVPEVGAPGSLVNGLDRLDTLANIQAVADEPRKDTPLSMRWGLFQGRSMSNVVNDAYLRELNGGLLPAVTAHFANRLSSFAGEPDKLYEYLKAYLMLATPERLDAEQLAFLADVEWQRVFANDPATLDRVRRHFAALLAQPDRIQPAQRDEDLVKSAQVSLKQASLPVLMFSRLKLRYGSDTQRAIDLASQVGLGGDTVFIRKSGLPLSEPISALYTKPVFNEIAGAGTAGIVAQFVSESWVLGDDIVTLAKSPQLTTQLMDLYEQDYIRVWDNVLADVTLRPTSGTQDAAQLWGLLAAPTSPFKRLLTLVQANTKLVDPTAKPDLTDKAKKAAAGAVGTLGALFGADKTAPSVPGAKVTKHFESLHKLVEGAPAPIDATLQKFAAIQGVMAEISAIGGPPPLETAGRLSLALRDLETHAKTLPQPMGGLVARASGSGASTANQTIGSDFAARYRQQVVAECRDLADGRYPLAPASGVELPLADFARIFGPNGTYDGFLKSTLQGLIDVNRTVWRWKPEAAAIGGAASVPVQFQRASRIMQTYFPASGTMPEVRFTVTPDFLDAAVTRMTFEFDNQRLEYRHGPQRAVSMVWPGQSPGQAVLTLEERSGQRHNLIEQGSWGLFRLLGKADLQAQGETRFIATYTLGGRSVRLIVQASSSRNPFARDLLHGFRCQG